MKLGIIGYGVVGKAVGTVFMEKGHEIKWKTKTEGSSVKEIAEWSDMVFICVGTPTNYETETYDLTDVDSVVDELAPLMHKNKPIVLKSTVVPGTTLRYQTKYPNNTFLFNPEFLTAATPEEDFRTQDRIVIGGRALYTILADFYKADFPDAKIFVTENPTEAEMVKYMGNTFLATKVLFANEMFTLCQSLNCNYDYVRHMVGSDKRIGDSHLSVTDLRGFSGMCFPKDTVALINRGEELLVDMSLLKVVWEKNKRIRIVKDWK